MSSPEEASAAVKGCILDSINRNKNGDYYIIFRLPKVPRGMHGKSKGHVDELLIVGVPQDKLDDFLKAHYKNEGGCSDAISSKGNNDLQEQ